MKIALGQINTTVGAISENVEKMIEYAERANVSGADMIVFHELCIPGYPPKGLVCKRELVAANQKALERVAGECRGIGVMCGYIDQEGQKSRRCVYNAAALINEGEVILCHRKNALGAFASFDEPVHFTAGKGGSVWDFKGRRIGLVISEDAWMDKDSWAIHGKRKTVVGRVVRRGADLLVVIASSPFWPKKVRQREKAAKAVALRYGVPLVYVNQVGGNDSLVFDGGSFAVAADGRIIVRAKRFEEDLVVFDLNAPAEAEPVRQDDVEDVRRSLILGVRDFAGKCSFDKAVVGLSGGIDSAVVACTAVDALAKENVLAVIMPSMYSSPDSLRDAKLLAQNLGIEHKVIAIEPIYRSYMASLQQEFEGLPEDVTEENIQARIRGNLLMAFSNKFGHLVLATGNRSEAMTGYCTLYGDAAGGLAVIADVPKTMVYELAKRFNQNQQVIPRSVFDRAPSAELKPNQKDADTLSPYEVLDPILAALLDEGKTPDEVIEMGYDRQTVLDVVRRIYQSEHKRRQSPPPLFVSKSALAPGKARPIAIGASDTA
jgi:NAD+ synthase (glutamine-hydrolysing)